jgi:hypothetical protein
VARVALLALVAASCGRLRFDPRDDGGHAVIGDAPADACAFGPWSAPVQIAELAGTSNEAGPQLATDGVTLYFASDRANVGDLFVAVRPDASSPFGMASSLGAVNTTNRENAPTVTADQLDLLFESDRLGAAYCIYEAMRTSTTAQWPAATRHSELCVGAGQAGGPFITEDGLSLYYTEHDSTGELGTLMVATRAARGDAFSAGAQVPVGLTGVAGFPSLSHDRLTMYFEMATPTLDLYVTSRLDESSSFGTVAALPFNQANQADQDAAVDLFDRELFFASVRPGGAGGLDLYHVTRACQ